jgi:YjbR
VRSHQNAAEPYLTTLRDFCLSLHEAREERAWVGTRWCIRKKTFAHVLPIADGWPPAYVKASGSQGPATVVTFRVSSEEHEALRAMGSPFFVPSWWPDIAGAFLSDQTDWGEMFDLLTESYQMLAPKRFNH